MRIVSDVVPVVRNRWQVFKDKGIEVLTRLPEVTGPRNQVIEVWNHTCAYECFTLGIEIHAPWIASTFRKNLKLMSGGMKAPNPRVDRHTIFIGRPRRTDP